MAFLIDIRGCSTGYRLWLTTRRSEHVLPGIFRSLTAAARMAAALIEELR